MLAAAAGCSEKPVGPERTRAAVPSRHAPVLVEVTFRNIGLPTMTSSAIVVSSLDELRAKHAARSRSNVDTLSPSFDLTVPASSTPGPATIQIELETAGSTTHTINGVTTRYFHATYRVRNARLDGSALDTPRRNLTFLPVSTANTLGDSPILTLLKQDGTSADVALTRSVFPTSLVDADDGNTLVALGPDVLQVFSETDVTGIALPAAVTNIFPYGYVTRRIGAQNTRTLEPSPAPGVFEGVVTFAYRIRAQAVAANNPTTISFMMIGLDDSETRISQSLEEQYAAAADSIRVRAEALSATTVTLLPGGVVSGPFSFRRLCSVRTTGPQGAPTAQLVDVTSQFVSLTPNPYAPAGNVVPRTTNFRALFTDPVVGANSQTFSVRGSVSGPAYLGQAYTGNGTNSITTPTKTFVAGEEIDVAISSALSCPTGVALRLRIASSRGQGNYFPPNTYSALDSTYSLAAGDFNRDGKIDIVATNLASARISVFMGKGDVTFNAPVHYAVGRHPVAVATADLNGDGILDVAVANELDRTVSVLLGRADGTFGGQATYAVGGARALAIADENANGTLDIAAANAEGTLSLLLNDGTGRFIPQLVIRAADAGVQTSIAIADLNRDGNNDIAVTDSTFGRVSVWLGNGNGTLRPEVEYAAGSGPSSLAIGDFNNDAIPDLAITNQTANTVSMLLGTGSGTFQPRTTSQVGNRPASLVAADLNGDGNLDVSTANIPDREASTLIGNGNGTFQGRRTFFIGESPRWIIASDFNNDGILDLAVANAVQAGTISVFQGRQ
jgi:hypothetical protein